MPGLFSGRSKSLGVVKPPWPASLIYDIIYPALPKAVETKVVEPRTSKSKVSRDPPVLSPNFPPVQNDKICIEMLSSSPLTCYVAATMMLILLALWPSLPTVCSLRIHIEPAGIWPSHEIQHHLALTTKCFRTDPAHLRNFSFIATNLHSNSKPRAGIPMFTCPVRPETQSPQDSLLHGSMRGFGA